MELRSVLELHARLYPEMEIQDMVKLVYQNEFAGGHLIRDEEESFKRLLNEYQSLSSAEKRPQPAFIEIGNGLCRLELSALDDLGLSPATANRFFVNTARMVNGSIRSFEAKLDVLRQCCRHGILRYSHDDLESYLVNYRGQGYPPVHHSETYRTAYSPAYRIVKSDYRRFLEIFLKIDSLLKSRSRVIIAIDGNSGSGKSTLADLIAGVYDCNLFHMDHFFLRPEQRTEQRMKETGGNVDYERFHQEIIMGLTSGESFQYRIFDCSRMDFGEVLQVEPKPLNIIEGSYSMHPTLAENYDLKIFVHVDPKIQAERILERNGKDILKRFLCEWIPKENQYFGEMRIQESCDFFFNMNGE